MEQILTPDKVEDIFIDCLFKHGEYNENRVVARGVVETSWFHPERLESHRAEIEMLLNELPEEFRKDSASGGASFLEACYDKHGNLWTGLHRTMERLFQLGIAIGKVECLAPPDLWTILPGGMPYFAIN